jgi:cytochrome bd-type quinol oxidase subunit 1
MYTGLTHLHSLLRWLALIAIVVSIFQGLRGITKNIDYSKSANRWSLYTLITFHLQLVIGLILYFTQGWYAQIGEMGNDIIRFYSLEHLLAMLIAIALVTVGRVTSKRGKTDRNKYKFQFWYYLIAFLITVANIPWPFREIGQGRSWFPGL